MKTINVPFTDDEHQKLLDVKGDLNWHDFILEYKRPYDIGRELVMVKAKLEAVRKVVNSYDVEPTHRADIYSIVDELKEILGESHQSKESANNGQ